MEKLTIALIHLTKDDVNDVINKARIAHKNAIKLAKVYNLDREIIWLIDFCGYTPEQALREFDLL